MPIYTYQCRKEHVFDKLVALREAETKKVKCPDCGGVGKRTLVTAFDTNPSKTKESYPLPKRQRFTNW